MEIIISGISLFVSFIAIAVSYYILRRTEKVSKMPILVFVRHSENTWHIQNVGQGPAISVMIGDRDWAGEWTEIVLYDPLAAGAILPLSWLKHGGELGALYTDITGNKYSSLCSKNTNTLFEKNIFPKWKPTKAEYQLKEGITPSSPKS